MSKNLTPWRVSKWWHVMHPNDVPKGYKGKMRYRRPTILDANGCFIAEFGVGYGFEHANEVAHEIVRLVNANAKKGGTR